MLNLLATLVARIDDSLDRSPTRLRDGLSTPLSLFGVECRDEVLRGLSLSRFDPCKPVGPQLILAVLSGASSIGKSSSKEFMIACWDGILSIIRST